jgi:hypothetical protein
VKLQLTTTLSPLFSCGGRKENSRYHLRAFRKKRKLKEDNPLKRCVGKTRPDSLAAVFSSLCGQASAAPLPYQAA